MAARIPREVKQTPGFHQTEQTSLMILAEKPPALNSQNNKITEDSNTEYEKQSIKESRKPKLRTFSIIKKERNKRTNSGGLPKCASAVFSAEEAMLRKH